MERLTKYDEFGNVEFIGIDNTKLYERLVCDETVLLTIATNKLGKLEDVLEEFELTSAEDLRNHLNFQDNMAMQKLAERRVGMEEKERYEWDKLEEGYEWIRDNETVNQPLYYDLKTVAHLLNQQDKRIKELELLLKADKKIETNSLNGFEKLRKENQQLKKQLEEKEKEIKAINNYQIKFNIKPYIFTAKYERWSIRQTEDKHKYLILVEEEGKLKPAGSYSTKSKRLLMYNVKYTPPLTILEKIVTSCELFERM